MDFSFTDEQQMLRDGVARYLEKEYHFDARQKVVRGEAHWSAEAWAQYAEFGLLALPIAEEAGGLGGSISDCVAVAELFGKHLVVEPYLGSVMLAGAALAASDAGNEWLGRIMAGEAIAAFAFEEGKGTPSLDHVAMAARAAGDGYTLSGEKRLVLAGKQADVFVVAARTGEGGPVSLFLVQPDGVEAQDFTTIDGCSAAHLTFKSAVATLLTDDRVTIDRILTHAIIVQCAEAVGAMQALLAITADYAMTRKQFGTPIGAFQVVAHRLADMKIACTKARATLLYTTALTEAGQVGPRELATLKGQTGKLGRMVGEAAIQTHGGVGMTDELSVSHYHKRLLALDARFGSHDYHLRTLGAR
ncbi:acyl-CoA dehydrogenase family protein [Parerythrobacter aurantius]|uniref:acyl-CoA dehydrogenase family protein n=1 Tax=Parerythrobacter aurantius TaxID=3127706 RepID=UPI0032460415